MGEKIKWLEKYAPPGIDIKVEVIGYIAGVFLFGVMMCGITLFRTGYYYTYHYQGSKMMYLMKRLPDKWEVHRRCWTLPLAGTALLCVWMLVLRMLYFAIYMVCTPSQCLPL